MTDTPVLDEVERALARTLHAKADQLTVHDEPFDASVGPPLHVVPLTLARRPRRRLLRAAAAAVIVGGLAAAALAVARQHDDPGSPELATAPGAVFGTRPEGTAGFLPGALPAGWALQEMTVSSTYLDGYDERWQLFGGPESPMDRGVMVGSVAGSEGHTLRHPNHTIQGRPAEVGPSPDPSAPPGTLWASWIDGDVVHKALARGMDEAELVAFLDTLVARPDPAAGFDAGGTTPLPEVAGAAVEDVSTTSVTYADPGGGTLTVRSTSSDVYGGLLHRLAGTRGAGGYVLRSEAGADPGDLSRLSIARDDGWTVDLVARGAAAGAADPGLLDAVAATLAPVTTAQFVGLAAAQPVIASYRVDGWKVDVHGTPAEPVALCLTPAGGATVCTTAEHYAPVELTAGSALVGGQWIVVAVTEGEAPDIRTTDYPPTSNGDPLDPSAGGVRGESGGATVQVVPVPPEAEAVSVMVWTTPASSSGFTYLRPVG